MSNISLSVHIPDWAIVVACFAIAISTALRVWGAVEAHRVLNAAKADDTEARAHAAEVRESIRQGARRTEHRFKL